MFSRQLSEAMIPKWVGEHPDVVAAKNALRAARDERDAAEMADDFKRSRAANKAFKEAEKAYKETQRRVMKAPDVAHKKSQAAKMGVCQICHRGFKMKGRVVSHHGWKEHGGGQGFRGFRAGMCPGSRRQPLQVTKEDLEMFVREQVQQDPAASNSEFIKHCREVLRNWKQDARWMKLVGYR